MLKIGNEEDIRKLLFNRVNLQRSGNKLNSVDAGLVNRRNVARGASIGEIFSEGKLKQELIARIKDVIGIGAEVEFISEGDEKFVALYKLLKVVQE